MERSTCYNCHPGKGTKCLRGAMEAAGSRCQDCHGNMAQVGDDFWGGVSIATPFPDGADLTKRIPWANEPGRQSCHVGDAVNHPTGADAAGFVSDPDDPQGFLLLQAWRTADANATPISVPNSRFAEDQAANGSRVL